MGTQKTHWKPPGGHLSSQGRLLEGTFYGPAFYMKCGSQNKHKKCSFLDRSTWLKHSKYGVELTFSCFFWGPGFSSVWDPSLGFLLTPFLTTFGTKMSAEGAKRRPRGTSGGGLFLGFFFGPTFESNLGPKGAFSDQS